MNKGNREDISGSGIVEIKDIIEEINKDKKEGDKDIIKDVYIN